MWWGHHSHHQRRGNALWFVIFIVLWFTLFSGSSGGGWWMIFPLFFFVIPMISRIAGNMFSESEKRKNDAYDETEKPKREPRPPQDILSEDGEPLEVIEEDLPRRKQKPDDIEYV